MARSAAGIAGAAKRDLWPRCVCRRASRVVAPLSIRLPGPRLSMLLTLSLLLGLAVLIYLSCQYFVNAIEWCGRHLNLGASAVGTVLAAFGTALPESAVTLTAMAFGGTPQHKDIGVGAALGGPLVLATLAYAVVGFALWRNRSRLGRGDYLLRVDHRRLAGDQLAFLLIFAFKVALGLLAFAIKPWLGVLFLAAYAAYVWREIRSADTAPEEEELDVLKLRAGGGLGWAATQALLALAVIAAAAHGFVAQLEALAGHWGMAPHLVALLLSPVATELPEIMNALIWLRQGKERLALANISGAMMIQATIPSAFGLFFTPWMFDGVLLWSGLATMAAIVGLWLLFRRGSVDGRWLLGAGAVYLLFAGCLV